MEKQTYLCLYFHHGVVILTQAEQKDTINICERLHLEEILESCHHSAVRFNLILLACLFHRNLCIQQSWKLPATA